jgi:hypothetical protein
MSMPKMMFKFANTENASANDMHPEWNRRQRRRRKMKKEKEKRKRKRKRRRA